jgi:hypothetical protein
VEGMRFLGQDFKRVRPAAKGLHSASLDACALRGGWRAGKGICLVPLTS